MNSMHFLPVQSFEIFNDNFNNFKNSKFLLVTGWKVSMENFENLQFGFQVIINLT